MPVLDMLRAQENGGFELVFPTMLFPDDPRARRDFVERCRAEIAVAGFREMIDQGVYKPECFEGRFLVLAEFFQRLAKTGLRGDMHHGLVAGAVLGFILGCTAVPELEKLASVGTAIRALKDPKLRGYGEQNLRQAAWPKYSSVSHFWAAFVSYGFHGWDYGFGSPSEIDFLLSQYGSAAVGPLLDRRFDACAARFDEFLAVSEILRRRGEAWVPRRGRTPVLDQKSTWRIPDGHKALTLIPDIEKRLTFAPPTWLIKSMRR
jgi:hypothetical protein